MAMETIAKPTRSTKSQREYYITRQSFENLTWKTYIFHTSHFLLITSRLKYNTLKYTKRVIYVWIDNDVPKWNDTPYRLLQLLEKCE